MHLSLGSRMKQAMPRRVLSGLCSIAPNMGRIRVPAFPFLSTVRFYRILFVRDLYYLPGSTVSVYGTSQLKPANTSTGYDPSWECFIDGVSIGSTSPFPYAENNWQLCDQSTLNDGPHTLTVNATSNGQTFWFDYILYTPSASSSTKIADIWVNNTDPDISYGSGWSDIGNFANMTTTLGSQVQVNFTGTCFCIILRQTTKCRAIGTSLRWYGYIPTELSHNATSAMYSIDGASPVSFPLDGLPSTNNSLYNQLFFSTPQLSNGTHNLVVVYEGDDQHTPLTLNYLVVTDSTPSSALGGAQPSSSLHPSTPSGQESPSSPSGLAYDASSSSHSSSSGAIIGGAVGGGAAFIILALIFLITRRRRNRERQIREEAKLAPCNVSPYKLSYKELSPSYTMPGSYSQTAHSHLAAREPPNNSHNVSHITSPQPAFSPFDNRWAAPNTSTWNPNDLASRSGQGVPWHPRETTANNFVAYESPLPSYSRTYDR